MSDDRPLPIPDPGTAPYWSGTREHKLKLPRCKPCGNVHFYPRTLCPHCGSNDLEWIDASGKGSIYSYTIVHRPPSAAFKGQVPYIVAVVALAEGPHLMTQVRDCALEEIRIGLAVTVAWDDIDATTTLPYFVLATH